MKPLSSLRRAALWPIVVALPAASVLLWFLVPSLLERSAAAQLAEVLPVVSRLLESELSPEPLALQARLSGLARGSELRITLVRGDGLVLADSSRGPDGVRAMDNHAGRPEIREAFARGQGASVRRSATTGLDYVYAARRLTGAEGRLFVLRLAQPLRSLRAFRGRLGGILAATVGLALAVVGLVWWGLDRRLYRPLRGMMAGADRLAHGHLDERLQVPDAEELGPLASAINRIAGRAQLEVGRVEGQRNRLREILASMSDGVVVAGGDGRVLLLNPAFRKLFAVEGEVGERPVIELVRRPAVAQVITEVLESGAPTDEERLVTLDGGRTVALRGQPLAGGGAVVVAQEVTERLRLERTRRDFVANVSHELRTPLTAIRGHAENLRDGALAEGAKARRFVERILAQCRRLEALLDDLLTLARLEEEAAAEPPLRRPVALATVVTQVVETVGAMAAARRVELEVETASEPTVAGDPEALERMVLNLVDNAVKYNRDGGSVSVRLSGEADVAVIEVRDTGYGIPAADLPRIFERFYRVDRGRGRGEGGTGLGLAIVKHAAQQHGGSVEVESRLGEGSLFRVRLPVAALSHRRRTSAGDPS